MDAQSLPKVKMPNRNGFALPPEWKHGDAKASRLPVIPSEEAPRSVYC
jgi:hypothetical protein